jgi:iron-sulfur cluster assembly protein
MDRCADFAAEDRVDEAVLLDAAEAFECGGGDGGAKVIAAAGVVLDVGLGPPDRGLDALLYVLGGGHCLKSRRSPPTRGAPLGRRYTLESLAAVHRSEAMIEITDKGAEKVHEFLSSQQADVSVAGLRVGVRGGGCSGFQYQLAFDEQRDSDVVFESHGLKLLVDGESLQFVRGSTIDYEESLQGAGFKVNNPNVVAACGCGSSFRVAEEEQVSAV